jgi:hypothetical protein
MSLSLISSSWEVVRSFRESALDRVRMNFGFGPEGTRGRRRAASLPFRSIVIILLTRGSCRRAEGGRGSLGSIGVDRTLTPSSAESVSSASFPTLISTLAGTFNFSRLSWISISSLSNLICSSTLSGRPGLINGLTRPLASSFGVATSISGVGFAEVWSSITRVGFSEL